MMAQATQGKTLKIGVVGGGFGQVHILAYRATPGVEVTAFCQRTKARAEQIARKFGIPHVFTDYGEMLAQGGLDAVSLTTPTNVHLAMASEAFNHGVSVLCEKPLAMNKEEAAAMLKRGDEARLTHMTAFNFRFIPAFSCMKELMEEGYVGSRVLHVEASWFSERRADPNVPFGWRDQKEAVGFGAMGDMGVHLVDLVRWLAGDFKRVCGQQAIFTKERPLPGSSDMREVTVEDCAVFIGELAGGGLVSFAANAAARGSPYQEIRILGNHGVLRAIVDRTKPDWMIGELWGAQGSSDTKLLPIPEPLTERLIPADTRRTAREAI
ncbi:MAG TPA: Gfo/Idh/MocA family oxidoreductase, partial [Candidatus Binatia bacterium]|nr:Gfo/Idh/MocA family oxidoreductase [Candidatus Binatia bacterium]